MSRDILITLLEASFKERLGLLEKRVDREMKDLAMNGNNMNIIEKCVDSCNLLTTRILQKKKEKEKAEEKRRLERIQKLTESKQNRARGKSMPASGHNPMGKHKTASSLLTSSTIDKSHSRAMKKNQSSGDIMRTADQMARDKQINIELTPMKNKERNLVKSSTSRTFNTENTPNKPKKKNANKTIEIATNDKDAEKGKEGNKDEIKRLIKSSSKKTHTRKESKSEIKAKGKPKIKPIEKKPKKSEEESEENTEKKEEYTPPINLDSVTKKMEFEEEKKQLSNEKFNQNEEETIPKEPIIKQENKEKVPLLQIEQTHKSIKVNNNEQLKTIIVNWGTISKLLTHEDQYTFGQLSKACMKCYLFSTKTNLQIELTAMEMTLNDICQRFSSIDLTKHLPPFGFAKGGSKAMGLLNDELYYNIFINNKIPQKDIIIVFRIFFQLYNKEKDIIQTKDDTLFWSKTCKFFVDKSDKTVGILVEQLTKSLDFSNENIFLLKNMCRDYITKLTPLYYSKLCPTTGLFIFIVKEVLEYCGIVQDKKINPVRVYKNLNFFIEMTKAQIMKYEDALK